MTSEIDTRKGAEGEEPLVSVIVPAHNAERYVTETLRSVLTQTYRKLELIVIDDGSADRTAGIVEDFVRADPRVRLLRLEKCRGVAAARNRGIRESRGSLIAPLDADDIWYPAKLQRQVELMQSSGPRVGVVYAWSAHLDEEGRVTAGGNLATDAGDVFLGMILRNFVGHASAPLIRRRCLDHVGLYEPRFAQLGVQGCEDRDIYLRLAEHYEYALVPEVLVGYRRHDSAMSRNAKAMAGGNELILRELSARRRDIPDEIFRWARSQFYDYLSNQTSQSGQYGAAFVWMVRAVLHDPTLLVEGRVIRRLLMAPIKCVLKPLLICLCGNDREFWRGLSKMIWPPREVKLETLGRGPRRVTARARRMEERLARMQRQMQSKLGDRLELSRPQLESDVEFSV